MAIKKISDLLKQRLKCAGLLQRYEAYVALKAFSKVADDVFGQKIAREMRPKYVKKNILYVQVKAPVFYSEINLKSRLILDRMKKKIKESRIESIKCIY